VVGSERDTTDWT